MSTPPPEPLDRFTSPEEHDPEPVSRIVHVIDDAIPVTRFSDLTAALEALHGPDLRMGQGRWTRFEFRTYGRRCWCIACENIERTVVANILGHPVFDSTLIVCPDCGNKRCPRATHHDLDCTGSNLSGQPGSAYQ